jgi:hypothetical protein
MFAGIDCARDWPQAGMTTARWLRLPPRPVLIGDLYATQDGVHLAPLLDDAPTLYVQLRAATLLPGQAEQTEQVTISRGSPMPLNTAAFHYAEQLANLLGDGEDEVRRVARWTRRRTDGIREGRQVADSARFLERNLTAWISADAAQPCELLDWRSAVRRLPGFDPYASKAVRRYTQRCPGCGVRAITHRAGDDLMVCQNCGATHPYQPTLPDEADFREGSAA